MERVRKFRLSWILLILVLVTGLAGCNYSDDVEENGDYNLYYAIAGTDKLTTIPYVLPDEMKDLAGVELVTYLYDQMKTVEDENLKSVVPSNVFLSECSINNTRVMTMRFPESYKEMDNVSEILFRAAVVNTMIQVEGIDYIVFYVENQPLRSDAGVSYGLMNSSTFVSDVEDAMENLGWVDITLYFSDADGNDLIGEKMKLAYSANISIEQVIVEQLISGPITSNCIASVPNTVDVISVSTKDGVCYVNMDSNFLNSIADCTAQVTIYSIVNSLCELSKVKKVQIQVNGSSDYVYREEYSLSEAYEKNMNLVTDRVEVETQEETTPSN